MSRPAVVFLSAMLFLLPVLLYISREHLLAQILFFTQLVVLWGMLPFLFRNELNVPKDWSRKTLILTFIFTSALVITFVLHLSERGSLVSTNILESSVRLFSEMGEALLLLGICLAVFFVIAVLIRRRGLDSDFERVKHD